MTFETRMTRLPLPFDPERGAAAVAAHCPEATGALRDALVGMAGSSPYLEGLLAKEAAWFAAALEDPEAAFAQILAEVPEIAPDQIKPGLRVAKRRVALLAGFADLAGVWPLEAVTENLTLFADATMGAALRAALAPELRRGKVPGQGEADLPEAAGMVMLAMGKMGAFELNYSSDIDLICLFDQDRFAPDAFGEARAAFVRATRKAVGIMSDPTGDGYVFRTDLRLRPDPSVTPVCIAMEAAERYYESLGRTWERAAHIKARPAVGDLEAGAGYLARLTPFIWRKHLDFAAIEDAHDMRLRIRAHKGLHGPVSLPGHDMKLGKGGIRDIEFFTQTRQIISGGRDPDLRVRGTVAGLTVLAEKGWVRPEDAAVLSDHYRAHREVEHRVQMIADAQTHALPKDDDGFRRLACLMGEADVAGWRRQLKDRLAEVAALTEPFFAPERSASSPPPEAVPEGAAEVMERWRSYPALRSTRALEIFGRLRPEILSRLGRAARPDEALLNFDSFIKGLPAGVQLFSLFEANPSLIDLIVDICATAPLLSRYLAANSGVLDAVIGGPFFADWPGEAALAAELEARLAPLDDYEHQLDAARRWQKEWHFRVGVHHLRGLVDAQVAAEQYTDLAETVVSVLWPRVAAELSRRHGPPPGRGAVFVGMGSLGARTLTAQSDLDAIVVYDGAGVEASEGRRPLAPGPYYAKLTKAMITALTAPMAEGRLYEIDMRLRPSGRQGPVATSWSAFQSYQESDAWTWEHLALTRARVIGGAGPESGALAEDLEAFRCALLRSKGPGRQAEVARDVADMRARLEAAKPAERPFEAKQGPGRLQDIELLGQAAALLSGAECADTRLQLAAGVAAGCLGPEEAAVLTGQLALLRQVQTSVRLLTDGALDPDAVGAGGQAFLLRQTGRADMETLRADMATGADAAAEVIVAVLARWQG
ncbi:bifunctional [glutamine synthetase] adenylyltransferase/[glutamine synthetase]-adenylyl-L-tyrosine phosphorylase [Dinoroseobacter sp. PD6]|uniref:bifunctional [glutamine synthetase] adenylyltransferase/[glutamine synthetase]-adenylyl-L-tyrosine phosphorylase n=1 Tax=Dinoroseobacter sp. PD6 TaxID=3028384 RepID=UPI00237C4687|nr:bifunctional [glutamine synthetase] adenylyltransferase/[glutamine synthetase]-adenylyl-L-tyrosine phosphorylase [Dinoroseobacter sp. PD6]MDD9715386.1 bifunctional [glutamine synthetase] adenylyltransferase/[glutamine synthetase]-adenylyl-L-tyrosine phosphorylase [Dinoroseobacter sp. PD6]